MCRAKEVRGEGKRPKFICCCCGWFGGESAGRREEISSVFLMLSEDGAEGARDDGCKQTFLLLRICDGL